jgi:hypothetical protein
MAQHQSQCVQSPDMEHQCLLLHPRRRRFAGSVLLCAWYWEDHGVEIFVTLQRRVEY